MLALLPGGVFHPRNAIPAIEVVVAAARERDLPTSETLDALLRMERSLRALSRVKPAYAYRPEALAPPGTAGGAVLAGAAPVESAYYIVRDESAMIAASTFDARLVRARALTPAVRELTFERVDGQPMAFAAGQFCNALLPLEHQGVGLKRSYSIASPPDGSPRFDLAITLVRGGPGSEWLHAIPIGTVLPFNGPQGVFTRPVASAPPSLMVATGTGVTPFRSMIRDAIGAGSSAPMWLLLGVRHEEDLLYEAEFRALAREHPLLRFEATFSQPRGAWTGRRGYVQTHTRELLDALAATGAGTPHTFICGLERMVSSVPRPCSARRWSSAAPAGPQRERS